MRDVLPFLIGLIRADENSGIQTAAAMELEERDVEFLKGEAKLAIALAGPTQTLDPNGFKLPFMGKDKFVQLMRVGLKYDSSRRGFSVRRMDKLDSVEESLSQIIGQPVKFLRSAITSELKTGDNSKIMKTCYVDTSDISCDECEFVESCPTHFIQQLKYCICTQTLSDTQAYEKYVAKNHEALSEMLPPKKKDVKKSRPGKRKKD